MAEKKSGTEKRKLPYSIGFRVDERTHGSLTDAAFMEDISVAEYVRQMVLQEFAPKVKRRAPKKSQAKLDFSRAMAQFGKLGGNVNQLAHVANLGWIDGKCDLPTLEKLDDVRGEIGKLRETMIELLAEIKKQ